MWVNPYLTEFDVSNNSLTGDLPSRLAKMEHLQFLNLAGNRCVKRRTISSIVKFVGCAVTAPV